MRGRALGKEGPKAQPRRVSSEQRAYVYAESQSSDADNMRLEDMKPHARPYALGKTGARDTVRHVSSEQRPRVHAYHHHDAYHHVQSFTDTDTHLEVALAALERLYPGLDIANP